jgi:hypothetical protein
MPGPAGTRADVPNSARLIDARVLGSASALVAGGTALVDSDVAGEQRARHRQHHRTTDHYGNPLLASCRVVHRFILQLTWFDVATSENGRLLDLGPT